MTKKPLILLAVALLLLLALAFTGYGLTHNRYYTITEEVPHPNGTVELDTIVTILTGYDTGIFHEILEVSYDEFIGSWSGRTYEEEIWTDYIARIRTQYSLGSWRYLADTRTINSEGPY